MKCHKCRANPNECGGYLARMNPKGETGIWECRPSCEVNMHPDKALLMALKAPVKP